METIPSEDFVPVKDTNILQDFWNSSRLNKFRSLGLIVAIILVLIMPFFLPDDYKGYSLFGGLSLGVLIKLTFKRIR